MIFGRLFARTHCSSTWQHQRREKEREREVDAQKLSGKLSHGSDRQKLPEDSDSGFGIRRFGERVATTHHLGVGSDSDNNSGYTLLTAALLEQ